jgi:hypothetical protein
MRYNVSYIVKNHKITKKKKEQKDSYEKYDNKGNVIEEGAYGAVTGYTNMSKSSDSNHSVIISIAERFNYRHLNTISFNKYDTANHLIEEQLWQCRNDKKDHLISTTKYDRDAKGALIKETEYDDSGKISSIKSYNRYQAGDTLVTTDSVYNFTNEGTVYQSEYAKDITHLNSLQKPTEEIHYYQGKFLNRIKYTYGNNEVTELRYDDKPDSLWSITERYYDYKNRLTRIFCKMPGQEEDTSDEVYIYNKKGRLEKILQYWNNDLTGFTKFKYK